jgi:hypothetical protein
VVIPNTLELSSLWVSSALDDEVSGHPHLARTSDFLPIPFLPDGSLDQVQLFPECIRARRPGISSPSD